MAPQAPSPVTYQAPSERPSKVAKPYAPTPPPNKASSWTPEDDTLLPTHLQQHAPIAELAPLLQRSEKAIVRRMGRLRKAEVIPRGYERNLLAVEMKRQGNHKKENEDKERLMSLVSPTNNDMDIRCVHDTLLGSFIIYTPEEVMIEFYENVNGRGQKTDVTKLYPRHIQDRC